MMSWVLRHEMMSWSEISHQMKTAKGRAWVLGYGAVSLLITSIDNSTSSCPKHKGITYHSAFIAWDSFYFSGGDTWQGRNKREVFCRWRQIWSEGNGEKRENEHCGWSGSNDGKACLKGNYRNRHTAMWKLLFRLNDIKLFTKADKNIKVVLL